MIILTNYSNVKAKDILRALFGKELFILFAASAFRKLSSIYVFSYFPFGFEGRIWDLIVSVPEHCLSFYFSNTKKGDNAEKIGPFIYLPS